MARAKKPALSPRDNLQVLLLRHSVREVAKILGVDRRTVQRRKNQGATPTPKNAETLQRAAGREAGVLRRQARRAGVDESSIAVPLPARRQTRRDPKNPEKRIPADTVIFDARNARIADLAQMLAGYRGKNIAFRIIYKLPAGKSDYQQIKYKESRMVSTPWESILQKQFRTQLGIEAYLYEVQAVGPIQYIVITLPKRRRKK